MKDKNLDNHFKKIVSSIESKTIAWEKDVVWEQIDAKRKRYRLTNVIKYAAAIIILFSSTYFGIQMLHKEPIQKTKLSREEKHYQLNQIEHRLSQGKEASFICTACVGPVLIEGSKPISTRFRVLIFYKSI